ncbi:hypothetical protein [Winogradskyella poriferorum]|uniref:IPExxxVDY family protein n=1 Tax=Winogradskyella poriferorum TaxID=307627 RepID=A0ABU7W0A1_9FLAO
MKVNNPPKHYLGHIYLEYTGNNLALINSLEDKKLINVTLFDYFSSSIEGELNCCFKIELLNDLYFIEFREQTVYKLKKEIGKYQLDELSYLIEYSTFENRNLFLIAGKLLIYNQISESDARNEMFNFNLIFENKEEIIKLFKH